MKPETTIDFINAVWDQSIIPTLEQYIRIPNKSPAFDPEWQSHGYMDQAISLLKEWCLKQDVKGLALQVHRIENRTPLLLIEVSGQIDTTVLLYGHLDKQPEMTGWQPDLNPWQPVIKNHRLYGRGGADDGYSVFAALTAVKALQQQNIPHARCVILIEASEESGSIDLPAYIDALPEKIGKPDLVICLDSGCGNYEQLWCTTSLRGLVGGKLKVEILREGVHSGAASGVVPSSFAILRQLLDRIDNSQTCEIKLDALNVKIPEDRIAEAKHVAEVLGAHVWCEYPWISGATPPSILGHELVLNRTWRPALCITGIAGIPSLNNAGNVLRPYTEAMLSIRIPPTCDAKSAAKAIKETLEKEPPHGAHVTYTPHDAASGWNAPVTTKWLNDAIQHASQTFYQKPGLFMGEGGSIPFMGMLGKKFPQAQFVITGVLGPQSNAHGPNEFLELNYAKRLTCCVASILADHYQHKAHS